jgi:S-adenosylmethionine:tRNA ribosyltransferase-isomerase|tara:strand:+ start:30 stop:1091 length:1062 start_codon:yes stop_codon:yes gene_type:complete
MRQPDGSRVSDYDYDLPVAQIAQYPASRRDESQLLVLLSGKAIHHRAFGNVVDLLAPNDVLVMNESKVLPVRLLGLKPTGALSEVFLLRPVPDSEDPHLWEALVRPGSKLKPGRTVLVADDLLVDILDSAPGGGRMVRLVTDLTVEQALTRYGHMPLPPYIDREDEPLDRERYQTVYAKESGSVAAPTAGLHFTPELLTRLRAKGVKCVGLTLHVGIGTFRPVDGDDPTEHEMHRECYSVPQATADSVNEAREQGGRVWAVGTTVVRTLESAVDESGQVKGEAGTTELFIRPGFSFQVVDGLLTNFHLPRSTLLMLVSAFAGYEQTMTAYKEAIAREYRFYSYGDAMAIVGRG